MEAGSGGAVDRDAAVAARYGVALPRLIELSRLILAEYTPQSWGLKRYETISDRRARAVASDLVVSSIAGAQTATTAVGLRQTQHADLLGPNGRTMPGPESTVEDHLVSFELEACVTDCVRAIGSAFDCITALTILLTGAPLQVQRAEGSWLLRRPKYPKHVTVTDEQEQAWRAVADVVRREGDTCAEGWLAWALETRNAVVHRGQLLRLWFNRPARRQGQPQLLVHTTSDPAYLVRMEPHMRRTPWLPDMHALTSNATGASGVWLPEPTQRTLEHLRFGTCRIVEAVAEVLLHQVDFTAPAWPKNEWGLGRNEDGWRVALGSRFLGFEPGYPTPPASQLRAHRDSAVRAELAHQVQRLSDGDGPERT